MTKLVIKSKFNIYDHLHLLIIKDGFAMAFALAALLLVYVYQIVDRSQDSTLLSLVYLAVLCTIALILFIHYFIVFRTYRNQVQVVELEKTRITTTMDGAQLVLSLNEGGRLTEHRKYFLLRVGKKYMLYIRKNELSIHEMEVLKEIYA